MYKVENKIDNKKSQAAIFLGNITISPDEDYKLSDQIVSADISRDNKRILFKTYTQVIMIEKDYTESVYDAMGYKQISLEYTPEPQGESVCWDSSINGFYTLSEEADNTPAHLYYYPQVK